MARACVLILDTSVLCCWLRVPGKEETGPVDDCWNHARIDALLQTARALNSTFVLPLATLIETGNHIAQAASLRFERASELARCLRDAAEATSPWAAFTDQSELWSTDGLLALASHWPALASQRISIGDATIKDVAEYYAKAGFSVELLTADAGLKAYQPAQALSEPRRRR